MSQHDYDIANQTAPNFRSDLNDALGAIATNNSGSTEPSVTYANQWWYDTLNNILKIRSEADDAWINVGYLDQSNNEFKPYVGGTQVDTQSASTWEAGTSTTEGIVSPAKVKAAIDSLVTIPDSLGVSQTWQDVSSSRSLDTSYQNTTGVPISVAAQITARGNRYPTLQLSDDNSTWVSVSSGGIDNSSEDLRVTLSAVIPNSHYYRVKTFGDTDISITGWTELR